MVLCDLLNNLKPLDEYNDLVVKDTILGDTEP